MTARPRLAGAGRIAALAATALALLATSGPPCAPRDRASFDAATTCGPAGVVTLAYDDAAWGPSCGGESCWAVVEAPGAAAVGLPELGEIHPEWSPPHDPDGVRTTYGYPPGAVFGAVPFALVGEAPVAGAAPPATVRRVCRASASSSPGVLDIACGGDAPAAACAGTLTLRPGGP